MRWRCVWWLFWCCTELALVKVLLYWLVSFDNCFKRMRLYTMVCALAQFRSCYIFFFLSPFVAAFVCVCVCMHVYV
ncbi:hypothetical protein, unlikely [Trypanosoma brucei gambiense DAL972]|uniref:Uncharacterized protein n=1 Tax=Trypanosoma brucei gambiense (strain MHOM/CI/86/DAL972) TaxID=679716 RepID=C9ZY20_TRYB9|nr:hypothetical protein, unlikely [Trypanosoma brucei gambiense DAL972]CBH14315.1 hypothetical protein, unlikely [Trypanosoma brucei gambiense DAL972]|eukprot:XP_011776585.1 hypothetical protein, unlikely [Trypanosoma brucei gambiense DAL972]